ncbi:MAG: hypothetical protein K2I78_03365, partial [Clostridia bacterium]|nr:hypothetical protein [Clostridia bacterium]
MKRKLAVLFLVAILLTMSMATLCACVDEEPEQREVELELVNPITGDAIKYGDTIDWPEEKTYIDVRIRDKETGEYLNDFDFPGNSIRGSYHIEFILISDNGKSTNHLDTDGYWPSLDKINSYSHNYNTFRIKIHFDCKPRDMKDADFQRKYATRTEILEF